MNYYFSKSAIKNLDYGKSFICSLGTFDIEIQKDFSIPHSEESMKDIFYVVINNKIIKKFNDISKAVAYGNKVLQRIELKFYSPDEEEVQAMLYG